MVKGKKRAQKKITKVKTDVIVTKRPKARRTKTKVRSGKTAHQHSALDPKEGARLSALATLDPESFVGQGNVPGIADGTIVTADRRCSITKFRISSVNANLTGTTTFMARVGVTKHAKAGIKIITGYAAGGIPSTGISTDDALFATLGANGVYSVRCVGRVLTVRNLSAPLSRTGDAMWVSTTWQQLSTMAVTDMDSQLDQFSMNDNNPGDYIRATLLDNTRSSWFNLTAIPSDDPNNSVAMVVQMDSGAATANYECTLYSIYEFILPVNSLGEGTQFFGDSTTYSLTMEDMLHKVPLYSPVRCAKRDDGEGSQVLSDLQAIGNGFNSALRLGGQVWSWASSLFGAMHVSPPLYYKYACWLSMQRVDEIADLMAFLASQTDAATAKESAEEIMNNTHSIQAAAGMKPWEFPQAAEVLNYQAPPMAMEQSKGLVDATGAGGFTKVALKRS